MTQFTDRFNDHALHAEIKALEESIASANLELPKGVIRDGYERFRRVFEYVKRRIAQADPELVSDQVLTSLQKQIHSLKDRHEAFKQNQDAYALNSQADAVLDSLYQLPLVADGAHEFSKALEDLRRRSNEIVDEIRDRKRELDETAEQLKGRLDKLHDAIVEQENRFESQKGRIDELITNQQAKFNEEQQQRNSQFNDAQKTHETSFDELIEKRQQTLDELVKAKTEAADAQRQEFEKRANEHMQTLKDHLDHAKKIVGLIGNTGMTGHYQKVANGELWRAEILRGLAVVFFILMVVGVGWVVKEIKSDDFNWQVALFRVVVALTLLAPAIYCARESTRHRRTENRNRRIELELASINPYLDSLPDEKAQEVKEQLAARYFGNEVDDEAK